MGALRELRSRAWAAVVVLVLVASGAVAVELGAGLKVWQQTVGSPPQTHVDGNDRALRPPSGLVTVPGTAPTSGTPAPASAPPVSVVTGSADRPAAHQPRPAHAAKPRSHSDRGHRPAARDREPSPPDTDVDLPRTVRPARPAVVVPPVATAPRDEAAGKWGKHQRKVVERSAKQHRGVAEESAERHCHGAAHSATVTHGPAAPSHHGAGETAKHEHEAAVDAEKSQGESVQPDATAAHGGPPPSVPAAGPAR
jgi:hypothetical protein